MDILRDLTEQLVEKTDIPDFKAGDNVTVYYKIKEGAKERVQPFKGNVIQVRGGKTNLIAHSQ